MSEPSPPSAPNEKSNDQSESMVELQRIEEAVVTKRRSISIIWIVPVIALLIAGFLAYKAIINRGPTITISFKSANGVQVKKTKVKYKDMTIGRVTQITLTDDFQMVRVKIRLDKRSGSLVSNTTRFWIERPRLQGVTVTGLDTLLSGPYITLDPGEPGIECYEFEGLESPPRITGGDQGKVFTLHSESLGSLDYGSPVYYRDVGVGRVVGYELKPKGEGVNIDIFVRSPYDQFVRTASRFWLVSGVELDWGANGVQFHAESLLSVMLGGIAFLEPSQQEKTPPASNGDDFQLFANEKAAFEEHFEQTEQYLLKFTDSVRGLSIGAPVEFKGLLIGHVIDIGIEFNWDTQEVFVPVKIEVEGGRLAKVASGMNDGHTDRVIHQLVRRGLRAQLQSGNLITGQLFIALDFFDQVPKAQVESTQGIEIIPTHPTTMGALTLQASSILNQLKSLPLHKLSMTALHALDSITDTGNQLNQLGSQLNILLRSKHIQRSLRNTDEATRSAKKLVKNMNTLVDQDSPTLLELRRAIKDLSEAAKSVRGFADQLERQPDSLLRGKR